MNRFSAALFTASLCAVILYSEMQNIGISKDDAPSISKYLLIWIATGAVFYILERCSTYKLMLSRPLSFAAIYLAAPALAGICSVNSGMTTFIDAELMIAVPAAAVHILIILASKGLKRMGRER